MIPPSFFTVGLEVRYNNRCYVISATRGSHVFLASEFPLGEHDDRGTDPGWVPHDDPQLSVSWANWNNRAKAARLWSERGYPAFKYLDGVGNVKAGPSERFFSEVFFRDSFPLGILRNWKESTHPHGEKLHEYKREVVESSLRNYDIVSVAHPKAWALNYRGWKVSYRVKEASDEPGPEYEGPKYEKAEGGERGKEGMTAADKFLVRHWILL